MRWTLELLVLTSVAGCSAQPPQRVSTPQAKVERAPGSAQEARAAAAPREECPAGPGAAKCAERALALYDTGRPEDGTEAWRVAGVACRAGNGAGCDLAGWILQENAPYRGAEERTKNLSEAREYFSKACSFGDASGCNNLGWLAINGWGGATDYVLARKVFASACASDLEIACRHLGDLHADGRGGPVDPRQAERFHLRALHGFERSCERSGEYCDFLAAGSTHWKLRTAEAKQVLEARCAKHEQSCFALALYLDRTGDKAGAERLWGQACENRNDDACLWLGRSLLAAGRPADARKWLAQGCTRNVTCCFTLAEALRTKQIKQERANESVTVYAAACDRGHPHACPYGGSAEAREKARRLLEAECHAEHAQPSCEALSRIDAPAGAAGR